MTISFSGAAYTLTIDRPGNSGKRSVCCPFCRQELEVVLFMAIDSGRRE
jgi:hypothetical protein